MRVRHPNGIQCRVCGRYSIICQPVRQCAARCSCPTAESESGFGITGHANIDSRSKICRNRRRCCSAAAVEAETYGVAPDLPNSVQCRAALRHGVGTECRRCRRGSVPSNETVTRLCVRKAACRQTNRGTIDICNGCWRGCAAAVEVKTHGVRVYRPRG